MLVVQNYKKYIYINLANWKSQHSQIFGIQTTKCFPKKSSVEREKIEVGNNGLIRSKEAEAFNGA